MTEAGLAARLEKVSVRLAADAPGLESPGADLIAYYLSPGRYPPALPWSRNHADTQRRLCARYLAPVIAHLACEDIKTGHMQAAINAAPTAKEGARVRQCNSALVSAGINGRYGQRREFGVSSGEAGESAARSRPRLTASAEGRRHVRPGPQDP